MTIPLKKKHPVDILLIIPIFNRWEPIKLLLRDLTKQTLQSYKVLIVNHGTQKSPDELNNNPLVTTIEASPQLWFTGAVNAGIRAAQENFEAKYLIIINDDVRIPDSLWLETMSGHSEEKTLCSSMALSPEGNVIYQNIKFSWPKLRFLKIGCGSELQHNELSYQNADCLPTRGIIFKPSAIDTIGYLDEARLPHYGSDYEWTIRAKKKGFKLLMANDTYIITETNPQSSRLSGHNQYPSPKLKSFVKSLTNPYINSSFPTTIQFARLVFPFPISILFAAYHLSRKIGGFFFSNYLRAAFKKSTAKSHH